MRLVWTGPALIDRAAIYDYIETDSPKADAELDTRFAQAAAKVRDHPEMGRQGRIAGTREWVAHSHYLLVYETTPDAVIILALVHTARRYPPLL